MGAKVEERTAGAIVQAKGGLQLGIVQGEGEGLCMILLVRAFDFLPRPLTRGDARPAGSDSDRNCQAVKSVFSFFFLCPPSPCGVCVRLCVCVYA